MKLDEYGNLTDHHPSCAMQIDPVLRCTCEREGQNRTEPEQEADTPACDEG